MTQEERGPVNAPEFEGGEWIQGGPVPVRGSGKVILVDFWDYTCVNCLRTLPYLAEWHRRYAEHGLVIVGVHTPEFAFARNADHVRRAVAAEHIEYPVVLDGEFKIWQAYANRYWPAKYFVGIDGKIKASHYGEGAYGECEQLIQRLLAEQPGFDAALPPLMEPVRAEDAPGAVCYRVTPELYCGYSRGLIGNVGTIAPDRPMTFTDPGKHMDGTLYLEGDWLLQAESLARPFGAKGPSRLHLDFMAADVNLVMHPPIAGGSGELRVRVDGAPPGALAGEDVAADGTVRVDVPRMYRLVRSADVERRALTLETESDGLAAFAFTFTSCTVPPAKED
jgi:thiol-disulfide isomerase/thioredoxin